MSDHIGDANKLVCVHCGLPSDREQNGIQGYRCGSSYAESFKPQWARSMTCLELQNEQLQERIERLETAGDRMVNEGWNEPHLAGLWRQAKEAKP